MKVKGTHKTHSRLPPDRRLADIMTAARIVIAEKGHENTMMSDIAQRAGIVEGTLYRFFKNKQELLVRVAEDWIREQLTDDPVRSSIRGTWNKLRHFVWRALLIIRLHPTLSRFVFTEIRPNPNYRSTVFFELNRRFTAEVRGICEEAIASGEFRDDVSPTLLRDMIFGCIEHSTWAFLRKQGDFSVDAVADGIVNVIYRGMVVTPSAEAGELDQAVKRLEKVAATFEWRQAKLSGPLGGG
jgi:TetR/AcrR family fatty acid metabolism transcriptional regulator